MRKIIFGLGLLSCLSSLGCGAWCPFRRNCCNQPAIVNTTPIAPAPCCNGAPGAVVGPGVTAVPAPVPAGVPSYRPAIINGGQPVLGGHN